MTVVRICPACGKNAHYGFTDKDGKPVWICENCGRWWKSLY